MSSSDYKYVILGGGNAAGYAANEFQKRGVKGSVAVLSDEPVVSYERPTLSKAYLAPSEPARLPGFHTTVGGGGQKHDKDWYAQNGIDFETNTRVTSVDLSKKKVSTAKGEEVTFERLIIALGSVAVNLAESGTPGADLENIFYLRDTRDADALVEGLKSSKKAVVIGGGYIGLEVAAACAKNGLDTTLVHPGQIFMPRLFTPEIAAFYQDYYKDKGIKIVKDEHVTGFEGTGKVARAVLKSGGKLDCDLVVVGIGARPNVDLFQGQLELLKEKPGGIKVDGNLETTVPGVYAIGDVAAFSLKKYGTVTRQEHVANARQSAVHAVSHILSPDSTSHYDYFPFFYSRVFDLSWQFYGDNSGADETVFFGDKGLRTHKFGTYFIKEGRIRGVFLESGSEAENAAAKKVAMQQPEAPSDLAQQGLAFATGF